MKFILEHNIHSDSAERRGTSSYSLQFMMGFPTVFEMKQSQMFIETKVSAMEFQGFNL